jgi:hypothetical protein
MDIHQDILSVPRWGDLSLKDVQDMVRSGDRDFYFNDWLTLEKPIQGGDPGSAVLGLNKEIVGIVAGTDNLCLSDRSGRLTEKKKISWVTNNSVLRDLAKFTMERCAA